VLYKSDRNTKIQFQLIKEIARILRRAHMRFWLRGGWALEFLSGDITRPHADIDLVTWKRHAIRVQKLLTLHGYRQMKTRFPDAASHFVKRGQDVGVVFICRAALGQIITPGFDHWPWPQGAFVNSSARLGHVVCRVMSRDALVEEKENYRRHRGKPLRAKDRESLKRLRLLQARIRTRD